MRLAQAGRETAEARARREGSREAPERWRGPMKKVVLLGCLSVLALVSTPRPSLAGCTTDLADCYIRAAKVDSFWYRWASGLDCELDYVQCSRVKLVGA